MKKEPNICFPTVNRENDNKNTNGRIISVELSLKKEFEKKGEHNNYIRPYVGNKNHNKFKDKKINLYIEKFYRDVLTEYYGKYEYRYKFYHNNKLLPENDKLFEDISYSSTTLTLLVLLKHKLAEYYIDTLKKEGHKKLTKLFDEICLSGSYNNDIAKQLQMDYDEEKKNYEHKDKYIEPEDLLKEINEIKNRLNGKEEKMLNSNNCITFIDSVKEKFQTYIQHIKTNKLKVKLLFLYVADESEANEEELIKSIEDESIQFKVLNKNKLSIKDIDKTSDVPTLYVKKINPNDDYSDENNTSLFDEIMSNAFPEIEKPNSTILREKALKVLIPILLMLTVIIIFSLTFFVRLDDPQLDKVIKQELGTNLPFITILDTNKLKTLSARNKNIKSIKGLEKFNLLTELSLPDNEIENISVVGKLKNLEKLDIAGNKINKIDSISELETLSELNLSRNKIALVNAVKDLKKLRKINLNYNQIKDISPIINLFGDGSKVTNVTIRLEHNNIELNQNSPNYKLLMEFLQNQHNNSIEIHYSKGNIPNNIILIPDEVLREQIKKQFYDTENYISLESVNSKDKCKIINITNGNCIFRYDGAEQEKISNLRGLEYFTNIEELHLPNNNIKNISALRFLSNLNTICLNNNKIEDITPLKYIDSLIKILVLTNNEIKNFDPINFLIEKNMINNDTYIDIRYNKLNVNKIITNENYHIYTEPQKNN